MKSTGYTVEGALEKTEAVSIVLPEKELNIGCQNSTQEAATELVRNGANEQGEGGGMLRAAIRPAGNPCVTASSKVLELAARPYPGY